MQSNNTPSKETAPVDPKELTGPIAWMARNRVAANLVMIIFIVGGLIMMGQVKQEVFPEFTTDIININVPYPGASPSEVETGIVMSLEDAIRGLEGVKRVTGNALEGGGSVIVELLTSANPNKLLQDVTNEVERISTFPEESEEPIVSLFETKRRVVSAVLYGDQPRSALRALAEQMRDELATRPGITLVNLGLAPPLEIAVEIDTETLRRYNLTLDQVAQIIRASALELPGGEVKTSSGTILLRTQERRDYGSEFLDIPITTTSDGTRVLLGDIASISDTFVENDQESNFNGQPAILVQAFRVGDETPQQVSASTQEYLEELRPSLPESVKVQIWEDSSVRYQDRMSLLLKNAALGLVLVLILLGLFLDAHLAFWVTMGIPISVLGCFLFFPMTGASINMISLFAFIITLGIIVDDAVVMGENIYEERDNHDDLTTAAVVGARNISAPITFAVLTNVIAFMPLFFVPGISGKFFRQIPSVTVCVFLVSLIESLYVLPAHLSHTHKDTWFWRALKKPQVWCSDKLHRFIHHKYEPAIFTFVKYRYITFSVAIASLLVAGGLVAGGHIPFTFLPKIDSDIVTVQASLPVGTPVKVSQELQKSLVQAANETLDNNGGQEIAVGVFSQIGGALVSDGSPAPDFGSSGGSHQVAVQVSLVSPELREIGGSDFAQAWRKNVGTIPGLETMIFKSETGADEGAAIEFNLSHRDRNTVEQAASELVAILESYRGVRDTDDGYSSGKRQLNFTMKPEGTALGLTSREVASQVRSAFYGAEALRQQRGRNEVKVMVRLPRESRESLATVENLMLRTREGAEIPLTEAVQVTEGTSYTKITRIDGRRVVVVKADVDDTITNANKVIADVEAKEMPGLLQKYPGLTYSYGGEKEAQGESLGALGVGFMVALLGIYALLAIPFRSYFQPLIVMLSIPFGIIGAIGGHYLLGYGLSIISMFGIIALSGVVVNDSLVLVVTANEYRKSGLTAFQAIQKAGTRRFRPILLTSLTTFFGLMPMIFETSLQARFLIPMAISIGFGILFATVIILVIVPAIYMILDDGANLAERIFGAKVTTISDETPATQPTA